MKILMKPIEMIAWFTTEKKPIPLRYRLVDENDTYKVIKVDRILFAEEEKIAGNRMILYRCQSIIHNTQKIYELKYEIDTCKWFLFKI
ncbi:hypothetical protein [Clostridium sp. Cult3]|uniref:hypothetical protein n=1 Tax=Clostridium sp. Cult3 TaxID=2079004 RepID=UPI001F39C3F5|nr:hypothetical protein [Clostridium sp. Cult3]MCF6459604.1 hypothetical protein [Clostridium sp. Cult3]